MNAIDLLRRRVNGRFDVDEWGLDPDAIEVAHALVRLRWTLDVAGEEHVPLEGPALLVANRRFGLAEPLLLTDAVHRHTGRFVRFAGIPDVAPVGPVLRRLGGVMDRPDEVTGLLDDGQLVGTLLDHSPRHPHRAGELPVHAIVPALQLGVPVVPAVAVGRELGRHWRIRFGRALAAPDRRGPLAEADWADRVRRAVQELLDEALPPRWPFG